MTISATPPKSAIALPDFRRAVAFLFAAGLYVAASLAALAQEQSSVADIAERLSPAVVNISTSQQVTGGLGVPIPELPENSPFKELFDEFFQNQQRDGSLPAPRKVSSLGSGFIIDPSGLVVTNNHVIEEADDIEVTLPNGTSLKAKVLGRDAKTDLALLKVESKVALPHVQFGDSDKMRVGDWVIAIGNPFGLGGSVTLGIVSARNRDINSGAYDDFIQTDAAINRGNSGGPLFDIKGRVVGVNTAIISPSGGSIGIGFAVPSNTVVQVIDQLRQYGETRRGWLGVKIQAVTDEIAETLGLEAARGALVAEVTRTGPAEVAGLEPGDVITSFAGRPITQMRDLPRMVANTPVGQSVPVTVQRQGKEMTFRVELGRLEEGEKLAATDEGTAPDTPMAAAPSDVLGMELAPLTDALRSQYGIGEDVNGAVVTDVVPGSAAEEKSVEPGDVITEAGEQPVT
ncbi:MAG: DegQ family serine endoprotease, partial [Aestuariivirgaceae bacterium]|nr:DegQ family serine endoprotease [Aestuariivirgaceae bacterium]